MNDHHDALRVDPDPSQAEELRWHLHQRLANRSPAGPVAPIVDLSASAPSTDAEDLDDVDAELTRIPTQDRPPPGQGPLGHRRGSPDRRLLVAAAALVLAVVGALVVFGGGDDDDIDTATAALVPESPFVGTWLSDDDGATPRTLYVDRWDADVYLARIVDGSASVCADVRLVAGDTALDAVSPASSCDFGFSRTPPSELVFTLTSATEPDQIVDDSGVVWSKQDAPPPDPEDAALLQAFLGARVAGAGAERYVGRGSVDDRVPLLYATTGGSGYERFEIERVLDPDGVPTYDVRLYTAGGTVVQQRFDVGGQGGRVVVRYGGPTLEDGRAVLLPAGTVDGRVRLGVTSTWEAESLGNAHLAFRHRFESSAIVIAAEPLSVGRSCEGRPVPGDAEALARVIAESGHQVSQPEPVQVAGLDGLELDVVISDRDVEYLCPFEGSRTLTAVQSGGSRMRLLLLDRPGPSAGVITFALMTSPEDFDDAIAETAAFIESLEVDPS